MVDWDRVEELRSKGWDWDRIAADSKVGFHPEASVHEPGRALRGLYHRQRSRQSRRPEVPVAVTPSKEEREKEERRWTLPRIGYLLVPIFALWFLFAFIIPSPIGLVLPAIPYLALGLVIVAFLLLYGLLRSSKPRWSKVLQSTVIAGVVIGLVIPGVIAIGAVTFFNCPVLPSSSTTEPQGWTTVSASPWQDSGRPVLYFFGATWCPYCSASSWAIWKALSQFGRVTGNTTSYSSASDVDASTPEMVIASLSVSSSYVSLQVSEDMSGVDGQFPTTSSCIQQAYVTAYSGSSIPFVVINGQFVHGGSSLVDPALLSAWAGTGATVVENSVRSENSSANSAWSAVSSQTWWIMTYIAKGNGANPGNLAQQPYYSAWSPSTRAAVAADLTQVS